MDADRGRQQTTKGVWLARSPKIDAPCTLVMDLEGSDGRERGEDDTNFERQTALFALAVADVLMVNVWCHDIGREHGSGKPLMKTIFQARASAAWAPLPAACRAHQRVSLAAAPRRGSMRPWKLRCMPLALWPVSPNASPCARWSRRAVPATASQRLPPSPLAAIIITLPQATHALPPHASS